MPSPIMQHPVLSAKNAIDDLSAFVFVSEDDIVSECRQLEADLKQGDGQRDYANLVQAIDAAEFNLRRAYRVWGETSRRYRNWLFESVAFEAGLRSSAAESLQKDKDTGKITKAITIADTDTRMMLLYAEELGALDTRRTRWEITEKSMENLCKSWESRCRTLQAMFSKSR